MKNYRPVRRTPFRVRLRVWFFVWWLSRYRTVFWAGLPAFVLACVTLSGLATAQLFSQEQQDTYRIAATHARASKDYAAARLYYQRLAMDDPQNLEFQYGLADSLTNLGQTEAAAVIIERLTPLEGKGYAPAHLAMAADLLGRAKLSPDESRTLELHLLRVTELEPNNTQARAWLGEHYLRTDRLALAEKQILLAVNSQPHLNLPLARLYLNTQRVQDANRAASRAADYYRVKAEASWKDHASRIRWADAVMIQGDCAPALSILEHGWQVSQNPAYHDPIARASVVALDVLNRGRDPRLLERIAVLESALHHGWANPGLLEHLRLLCFPKQAETSELTKAINTLLTTRSNWGTVHFLKALSHLQQNDERATRESFAKAFQLHTELAKAANNLAFNLSEGDKTNKPDLPNALAIMNYVLHSSPQDAQHRKTRGQILLKSEALARGTERSESSAAGFERQR